MFLKVLAVVAIGVLTVLAAFGVVDWEKIIWLVTVLISFIVGEKQGKKQGNNKGV